MFGQDLPDVAIPNEAVEIDEQRLELGHPKLRARQPPAEHRSGVRLRRAAEAALGLHVTGPDLLQEPREEAPRALACALAGVLDLEIRIRELDERVARGGGFLRAGVDGMAGARR